MKTLLLLGVCLLLLGCEYTVPLVTEPEVAFEPDLLGLWEQIPDESKGMNGTPQRLLVLPWSETQYLVGYPANSPDAMIAKACLTRIADMTLVQIEWIGTAKGRLPSGDRVYQYAAYEREGRQLKVWLLNSRVVDKNLTSRADLIKAIAANRHHAELLKDPMLFDKVLTK